MENLPPQYTILVSAGLLLIIMRAGDIQILCKRNSQRTKSEQRQVDHGLLRCVLLELLVFVPASAGLIFMIAPLLLPKACFDKQVSQAGLYAVLGIVSYGFPFATIRSMVTRVALNTLKEFAEIVPVDPKVQESD